MTTPALRARPARGLFGTLLLGNLGGALVTFAYFRFLDPSAMADVAPLGLSEALFFLLGFSALFLVGRAVSARWAGPLVRHVGALPDGPGWAAWAARACMACSAAASMARV